MAARTTLSKRIRFEVFKRDSFTCQYCGARAPNVLLETDHIVAVANGGTNDLLNLVAACTACNSGKSDRALSDSSVIKARQTQLEQLQLRREQIEMMFEWQQSLADLDAQTLCQLSDLWQTLSRYRLTESGLSELRKLSNKYSVEELLSGMRTAATQYLVFEGTLPTLASVTLAWKRLGGVCRLKRLEVENPTLKRLYYIRGILRNRLHYCDERRALGLLRVAASLDADIASLESFALQAQNWTEWSEGMNTFIEQNGGSDVSRAPHGP